MGLYRPLIQRPQCDLDIKTYRLDLDVSDRSCTQMRRAGERKKEEQRRGGLYSGDEIAPAQNGPNSQLGPMCLPYAPKKQSWNDCSVRSCHFGSSILHIVETHVTDTFHIHVTMT